MATAKIIDLVGSREWKSSDRTWENYHRTGSSRLVGRYALRSGDAGSGREDIAEAAREVQAWLRKAQARGVPVRLSSSRRGELSNRDFGGGSSHPPDIMANNQ